MTPDCKRYPTQKSISEVSQTYSHDLFKFRSNACTLAIW